MNREGHREEGNAGCVELSGSMLRRGALDDPEAPIELRAGPLTMLLEGDSLRYIRLGNREIVRRIYCAVRDRNWGTIPNRIVRGEMVTCEDSFEIDFDVRNVQGEIDFRWKGKISGDAEGTITFEMDGEAHNTFLRNRIGFCVLHPIEGCAGEACVLIGSDGAETRSAFPRHIDPENPFRELAGIRQELAPGVIAELTFEGDLFETEDQRNWTDASFKTFCTPLRLPFPVEVKAGDRVSQRVTLRIVRDADSKHLPDAKSGTSSPPANASVHLTIVEVAVGPVPQIGLGWIPHERSFDDQNLERLRDLSLSHLRCELHYDVVANLADQFWANIEAARRRFPSNDSFALDRYLAVIGLDGLNRLSHSGFPLATMFEAAAVAAHLRVPLELALHVSDDVETELSSLVESTARLGPPSAPRPEVVRWLIYHKDHWSTPWPSVETARRILAKWDPRIPIGGGSRASFLEINRNRPPAGSADFVAWPIHPQEHAFDDASLFETIAAQGDTVESARKFAGDVPLVVGPITFKRRVNPYAKGPPVEDPADQLPLHVDCRQLSLFGAAWTLGSLKHLAEAGAAAVTYYETLGWLGVMEDDAGSPMPALFPSIPGGVFPLYFVLADAGEMRSGKVLPVRSSDPLRVESLALQSADGEKLRLMIANPTGQVQSVAFETNRTRGLARTLDESNAVSAMRDPATFRGTSAERTISGKVELKLPAWSYTCLDLY